MRGVVYSGDEVGMTPYVHAWLAAFAFTQAVEVPVYRRAGCSWHGAFAASAITHPVVWFVIVPLLPASYLVRVLVAEAFAVLVEALWLHVVLKRPRALWWSLGANALSVALGLVSRALFGAP